MGIASSLLYGTKEEEEPRRRSGLASSLLYGSTRDEEESAPRPLAATAAMQQLGADSPSDLSIDSVTQLPGLRAAASLADTHLVPGQQTFSRGADMLAAAAAQPARTVLGRAAQAVDRGVAHVYSGAMDFLQRGTYGGMKAVDEMATALAEAVVEQDRFEQAVSLATLGPRVTYAALGEALVPQEKLNGIDLIQRGMPEWAQEHPAMANTLGFASDIALDPTTWLTFGTSQAIQGGLDAQKVYRLMERVGAKTTWIDRVASLTKAKGTSWRDAAVARAAERGAAVESQAALNRAHAALMDEIKADFHREVREGVAGHGTKAIEVDSPPTAIQVSEEILHDATAAVAATGKKLRFAEQVLAKTKSPQKRMEWGRRKLELEQKLQQETEHQGRVQQQLAMPPSRISTGQAAQDAAWTKQGHSAALRSRIDQARARATERKLELDSAREQLRGQTFHSGEELQKAMSQLLGGKEKVTIEWDTAYQRGQRLLADESVRSALVDQGGIKVGGRSVVPQAVIARAAQVTGLDRAKGVLNKFRQFFNEKAPWLRGRNAPIEQDPAMQELVTMPDGRKITKGKAVVEMRELVENINDSSGYRSMEEALEDFKGVSAEGVDKVHRVLSDVNDVWAARPTFDAGVAAVQQRIKTAQFTPEEDRAFRSMSQAMHEVQHLEHQAGVLDQAYGSLTESQMFGLPARAGEEAAFSTYAPRLYKPVGGEAKRAERQAQELAMRGVLRDPTSVQMPGAAHAADQSRAFQTLDEARSAGYEPVFNAIAAQAIRVTQSRRAIARAQYKESLLAMFPDAKEFFDTKTQQMRFVGLPEAVQRDLRFMGDALYPPDMWGGHAVFRAYDRVLGYWKRATTVVRPAFGVKQLVSNAINVALIGGKHAVDPRVAREAFALLTGKGRDLKVRTLLGEEVLGSRLLDEMDRHGIRRRVTVDAIGPGSNPKFKDKIIRASNRELLFKKWAGDSRTKEAAMRFVHGALSYTQLPAFIEDFSRATAYINFRRMGHTEHESGKLVNKALFDYTNGLQQFEARWVKRVIPFYSYQRFVLPMMAHVLTHTPGRVTNLAKTTDAFLRTWNAAMSGDKLTESEREVLPGFLMEQPHALKEFRDGIAVFNTFNSFSPLDALAWFSPDDSKNEETNLSEAVRKTGLAQIAPWFKVGLELAMERDFFTDRPMDGQWKIGPVDPDEAFAWAAASVTGSLGADERWMAAAGLAAKGAAAGSPEFAQNVLEYFLGWEEGIDRATGKRTVYVTPWRYHVATSLFPTLGDAFKLSRDDRTFLQKSMHTLFGVGTIERNLQDERRRRGKEMDRSLGETRSDLRSALSEHRYRSAAEEQEKLQRMLQEYTQRRAAMSGPIRGPQ